MRLLLNFVYLFLTFSFPLNVHSSNKCKQLFKTPVQESPLIVLAKDYFANQWQEEMGHNWPRKANKQTKKWNTDHLTEFLSFLIDRIGINETVKRMQSLVILKNPNYERFKIKLKFYELQIGEEKVTEWLLKDLFVFNQQDLLLVEKKIKFLTKDMDMEPNKLIQLIGENLDIFDSFKLEDLRESVIFLKSYLNKKEIIALIEKNWRHLDQKILLSLQTKKFQKALNSLKQNIKEKETIDQEDLDSFFDTISS